MVEKNFKGQIIMKTEKLFCLLLMVIIMAGFYRCSTIPKGANAVEPFDKERYLGKWYEIARMDFKFERNLIKTTAEYSLNENGIIRVVNQGYSTTKQK